MNGNSDNEHVTPDLAETHGGTSRTDVEATGLLGQSSAGPEVITLAERERRRAARAACRP